MSEKTALAIENLSLAFSVQTLTKKTLQLQAGLRQIQKGNDVPDWAKQHIQKVLNGHHAHMSDCAVHNEPAKPKSSCTCGYEK